MRINFAWYTHTHTHTQIQESSHVYHRLVCFIIIIFLTFGKYTEIKRQICHSQDVLTLANNSYFIDMFIHLKGHLQMHPIVATILWGYVFIQQICVEGLLWPCYRPAIFADICRYRNKKNPCPHVQNINGHYSLLLKILQIHTT